MKTQNSQMPSFKYSFYVIIYSELINSIGEVIPYIYFHVHVMVNLFFFFFCKMYFTTSNEN